MHVKNSVHVQVLDFPLFVNDGGASLKDDLKVRCSLIYQPGDNTLQYIIH